MRVRFGVGLPGPFYLSSGGSRRRRKDDGWGALIFLLVLIVAAVIAWPWQSALVIGGIFVLVVGLRSFNRYLAANVAARSAADEPAVTEMPEPETLGDRLLALTESYRAGYFTPAEFNAAYGRLMNDEKTPPPTEADEGVTRSAS